MKWEEYAVHNESMRNMEVIRETYVIAMYTITFATIGIGIQVQNPILFLLPYLVLFPFQRIIQNKNCNIQKRAAFVAVFGKDIWEKNYFEIEDEFSKEYHKRPEPKFLKKIRKVIISERYFKVRDYIMKCKMIRVSALHLGFACSVINLVYVISNGSMSIYYYCSIWMDLLLFCVLLFWCKHSLDASYLREKYVDAVERYKNSIEENKIEEVS